MFNFPISLFYVEIALVVFALACLLIDIFSNDTQKQGRLLANVAMTGVAALFVLNCFSWNNHGAVAQYGIVQDGLSYYFKMLFLLAAFVTLYMAKQYSDRLTRGREEFSLLILFALIGMVFMVSATDFLLFFVALETLTVSMYVMTAYLRDKTASIEAGVKYLVLGALSTAFFLYGLSFVYGATGSTSYEGVRASLATMPSLPMSFKFGMMMILASLGFKIAAVPFQLWTPDIYEGAPTPVTNYLAIGSKAAAFAALVRLMTTAFAPAMDTLSLLFAVLAALTIVYGNLGAIPQTNIKRLLGYSSIGHAGYLLIGLAAFRQSGDQGVLFYLLSYLFSTAGAFLVLIALIKYTKTDEISELNGLGRRSPMLAAAMMLSLFSLAGVPPLAGFFAKFYLLWSGVKAGYTWLVVIGVLNVVTSLYYYLRVVKAMYLEKAADTTPIQVSLTHKIFQYGVLISIVILGICPAPFFRLAESALATLIR